jgi:hypothetical protein
MTQFESEHFLNEMKRLSPAVEDWADAIEFALSQVPKVAEYTWLGQVGSGTFLATSRESRWFPNMTPSMVATILVEEMTG